jgi:acetyl-CoA carboxylase biotin carboxyl carrier protein
VTRIRSDMVANVWKVAVSVGDAVSEGDTIVILESMKTEIPVEAPHDGTVTELLVGEGASVGEGDVIAVVDR